MFLGKRQCEELTVKAARDFEEFYRNKPQTEVESSDDLLVLTMDGKGIVMHSADLREQTAKASQKAGKPTKMRLSPGEKKLKILEGKSADVAREIKQSATKKKLTGSQREKVDKINAVELNL